ncbi:telomerase activating protein est1 [Klebsormidium nitens]|uniref:Telomerase activating protein est1 n=1 Tax=Klebsormidium nitens TaxID=105231 RepID=A0A1Y1IMS9_KLENI|nr:telomerase activating protein est1 [Klebsormidium nitens]|eukprot:GAQ92205.1 telomerase activating protein est1 [Klebsormidium nitens]
MSQSGERDSRASAEALLKKAQKLEQQLRTTLQSKGFSDGTAYSLLTTLRSLYQEILLTDHAFAVEHDVEQALWRGIYRRIEDFRGRIRKYSQAATGPPRGAKPGTSQAGTGLPLPPGGAKPGAAKEALHKALAGFRGFLGDATGFYHELVFKLRALYGLPQDFSPNVPEDVAAKLGPDKLRLCQASCHRCLIYLGDLARYKELHSDSKVKDWAIVANYYLQAAALWPASGNPHNQLAVLATYVDDELLAVYRYYRSLAVEVPFLTARDNLLMLFEKNRAKYAQLAPSSKASAKQVSDAPPHDDDTISKLRLSFQTPFVRLNGIVFTKTSVETFSDVYTATMSDLDALFEADDVALDAGLAAERRSGIALGSLGAAGLLQVMVIAVFTVHNLSWVPEGHKPSYSEIIQSSALAQHALTALFELAGRFAHRCGLGANPTANLLLPSVLVLLEWLVVNPKVAAGEGEVGDRQGRARSFFWREVSGLLNDVTQGVTDVARGRSESNALWEDYELRGFEPLASAHRALDFSKPAPVLDVANAQQAVSRGRRVLEAGKNLAACLADVRAEGLRFSEELGLFQFSRGVSERRPEDLKVLERGGVSELGVGFGQGLGLQNVGLGQGLEETMVGLDPSAGGIGPIGSALLGSLVNALPAHTELPDVGVFGQSAGANLAVLAGFGQGSDERIADAETEEEDLGLVSSGKDELEAAKKELFQRAQQAGKLKGSARDELAVEAERVFRAQLAAKRAVKDGGKEGVKEGVKQTEESLDEDEEEIVFQPMRRGGSQPSPLTGSPMHSQSPRPDGQNQGPVQSNNGPQSLLPNLDLAPKQGLPSTSDPIVGSSAFSFNQWMPGGAKRVDAVNPVDFGLLHRGPSSHEKAKADVEAVTNDLLKEAADASKALDPAVQARGYDQLKQLYELQQQLQGNSFPGASPLQGGYSPASTTLRPGGSLAPAVYPPASFEAPSAQQQYYNYLLQQQQGLTNHGAPAQHQNGPGYQHWGASLSPWSHPPQSSSLFGGLGFSAPHQSGFSGANTTSNQGLSVTAQGPTFQEARVTIPLPKLVPSDEPGLAASSLFASPPVPNRSETFQALGPSFSSGTSSAPAGGLAGPTRIPPPGFGQPSTIRPPPGFGPPTNQRPNSPFTANRVSAPPQNPLETTPLDDYKWLDGYTHTLPHAAIGGPLNKPEHFRGEYAVGEPSIWGRSASPVSEPSALTDDKSPHGTSRAYLPGAGRLTLPSVAHSPHLGRFWT